MYFSSFCQILLAAAAAITSVEASPFFDLNPGSLNLLAPRDLSGSQCVAFVYGNTNIQLGQVCVTISGGNLVVTYPTISGTYTDLHVDVETSPITQTNQAFWPYTLGKGQCSASGGTASCTIPIQPSWRVCGETLYIAVHASFTLADGSSNTGWGNGPCIPGGRPQNCPKSFTMTTTCQCPVVYTFDPYTTTTTYLVTTINTITVSCSTTPAASTTTASCNDPNAGVTVTSSTTTSVSLSCPSPTPT